NGGFPSRVRNCGRGARRRHHHGRARGSAGRDRSQGCGRTGGTFLGILLCYGLVGPIAANMGKAADEERAYLNVLKVLIISFLKGTAPIMAVEAARRAIPGHVRPTFTELEQACRGGGSAAATPEAPAAEAAASGE